MKRFFLSSSKYSRKIFFYYFLVIITFGIIIALFQYNREREFKINLFEQKLQIYCAQAYSFIVDNGLYIGDKRNITENLKKITNLKSYLPNSELRITVIDASGEVYYDSYSSDLSEFDTHLDRTEIATALKAENKMGADIRLSDTFSFKFYYLAHNYDEFIIRTALPYNEKFADFLQADYIFIYFILALFVPALIVLTTITERFGRSIANLREFAFTAAHEKEIEFKDDFGNDELGEISQQIITIYKDLKRAKTGLANEKNKLIKHLFISHEGIAFFDVKGKLDLVNSHFHTYISFFTSDVIQDFKNLKKIESLSELTSFIDNEIWKDAIGKKENDVTTKKIKIQHSNRIFIFNAVVFNDRSFEISVNDITEQEKERNLKQQISLNIAHELKTPVAAVSGFLETILDNPEISKEKMFYFLDKSYSQISRLTHLIQDLSVLSKIEDAAKLFTKESLHPAKIVKEILLDYELKFKESGITVNNDIPVNYSLEGNKFLLDAIFRNLIDNSIKYAGKYIDISIECRMSDENFYYFSYKDNGPGIPEKHLTRIFERFYRLDKGRSRKLGGTGLGLSIVKNAVLFHGGEIVAKNSDNEKGLEFRFTLKKK